jgi:hypothetical protein
MGPGGARAVPLAASRNMDRALLVNKQEQTSSLVSTRISRSLHQHSAPIPPHLYNYCLLHVGTDSRDACDHNNSH